ncbi:hypothetical protein E2542_SST31404 [Spatholobus suberectus]|nr:hypothetical protein E2542_SST31404 [Spatholobus suberectus]
MRNAASESEGERSNLAVATTIRDGGNRHYVLAGAICRNSRLFHCAHGYDSMSHISRTAPDSPLDYHERTTNHTSCYYLQSAKPCFRMLNTGLIVMAIV